MSFVLWILVQFCFSSVCLLNDHFPALIPFDLALRALEKICIFLLIFAFLSWFKMQGKMSLKFILMSRFEFDASKLNIFKDNKDDKKQQIFLSPS